MFFHELYAPKYLHCPPMEIEDNHKQKHKELGFALKQSRYVLSRRAKRKCVPVGVVSGRKNSTKKTLKKGVWTTTQVWKRRRLFASEARTEAI